LAFVPVENTALVEFRMTLDSQKVENTLWVLADEGWPVEALTGLASNLLDWWSGSISPLLSGALGLTEIVCTDMTTDTSGQVTIGGGGITGAIGGDPLPNAMAAAIAFHTASRGRSFRGRNYLTGLPAGARLGANGIHPDFASSMVAAYGGLLTAVFPAGQTWVVASRFHGVDPTTHKPIPRSAGVTTPVTSVVFTDLTLDTQRRRGPGRGA